MGAGLKELQVRALALLGSAFVALMIGAANYLARVLFELHYGESTTAAAENEDFV